MCLRTRVSRRHVELAIGRIIESNGGGVEWNVESDGEFAGLIYV